MRPVRNCFMGTTVEAAAGVPSRSCSSSKTKKETWSGYDAVRRVELSDRQHP